MGKLIDVNKWFKDTFPNADLDYPILENLRAYPSWSTDITGLVNMLNDAESVEAIPKDRYEAKLKADMAAMLTDLQLEIEEIEVAKENTEIRAGECCMKGACIDLIQKKINSLKESKND